MGFPIRKSPDQSSLSSSPRHIAASRVLHRLLAPRHSPFALICLTKIVARSPEGSRVKPTIFYFPVLGMNNSASCGKTDPEGPLPAKTRNKNRFNYQRPLCRVFTRRPLKADLSKFGGADRVRTDDLRLAKPALSQLSYSPQARSPGGPR